MTKILEGNNRDWQLRERDDGKKLLSVLCGGIGMFEVEIIWSDDEVSEFELNGKAFIEKLAYDIMKDPKKYGDRRLFIKSP